MYDVVIIGAGIIGAMTLRKLSRYKLKVCILEKENDVCMGATKANSAIIHAGFDAKEGSLKAKLNVKGSRMMANISKELGVKYKNNGSLVIAFNREDEKALEELLKRGTANGVEGLKILSKKELSEIEPQISEEVISALYAPSGGIICPYELGISAIGNAMDNGAELITDFEVISIEKKEDIFDIKSEEQTVRGKFVINAAGINADKIAEMAGDNTIKITPRKGEYILLDKKCGNLVSHTIFKTPSEMGKGILVTPTVDGNLLLGPTSENISDKKGNITTSDGLLKVKEESLKYVKNIDFSKTITSFSGLRAVGNTGDFIINSPFYGFINLAGIESPGLSASPAIAEYACNLLEEQGLLLEEKEDFNPIRESGSLFFDASDEEKNEMIKKDKSYGKIVCRCEGITEGEIRKAVRMNPKPKDMDGIKRRTRATMGRCQGGFCSPSVAEILSEELGIPFSEITKSGKGSYINVSRTKEEI